MLRRDLLVAAAAAGISLAAIAPAGAVTDPALDAALHNKDRKPQAVARDSVRHPAEELSFYGIRPDMTVVEIWPGAGYWTGILAPYLHDHGTYYVAVPAGAGEEDKFGEMFRKALAAQPARFSQVKITTLGPGHFDIAPAGSADLILTFRNLHNWMGMGIAPQVLDAFYRALKPGGVLGVEDHRAGTDKPQDPKADNGYVRQDYAVALIEKAGFKLVGSSEMNANPRDTKNWPQGVWTLPPTFALGAKDHDKYAAIGEADNFVLKFQKPAQ